MKTVQMESECNTNWQNLIDECMKDETAFHVECWAVADMLIRARRLHAARALATAAQYCVYRCQLIKEENKETQ